jgi:hypothetical protein
MMMAAGYQLCFGLSLAVVVGYALRAEQLPVKTYTVMILSIA